MTENGRSRLTGFDEDARATVMYRFEAVCTSVALGADADGPLTVAVFDWAGPPITLEIPGDHANTYEAGRTYTLNVHFPAPA